MKTRSQSSMVLYASSMKRGDALRILGKHSRGTVRLNNINKMEAEGPFNPKRICSQSSNTYCPYNIWNNFLLQTQNINNIYHQLLQLWLQLKLSQLLEEWNCPRKKRLCVCVCVYTCTQSFFPLYFLGSFTLLKVSYISNTQRNSGKWGTGKT